MPEDKKDKAIEADGQTTSARLIKKYDQVYAEGENKFWTFLPTEERIAILQQMDLPGKQVLEIGCGTGDFAAWMASAGARLVKAHDLSEKAIEEA